MLRPEESHSALSARVEGGEVGDLFAFEIDDAEQLPGAQFKGGAGLWFEVASSRSRRFATADQYKRRLQTAAPCYLFNARRDTCAPPP